MRFHSPLIYSPTNTAHCLGLKFDTQTEDFLQQSHATESSDEVVALHTEASPLLATSPYHAFAAAPPCFLSSFFQAAERFFRFYQIQEEDLQVKTEKLSGI